MGEPLLQVDLLEAVIRGVREQTDAGTINCNTNGSSAAAGSEAKGANRSRMPARSRALPTGRDRSRRRLVAASSGGNAS